ncbi:chaperone protein HscA [Candidatus Phycorickettsia trachydisci]|uniref:Chaperone protein HscA n=1 Tax=Candidatus Phycorickettsia trachydisci TaxID=2115978 RepID=A0A2P1P849_9RICK|nr:Hsp70 family protein [Candidatus Phycorickettsia trachydisci]AVP87443.1 chaperone protein HscA [Candidatus Phycorickettsia trachydisci]
MSLLQIQDPKKNRLEVVVGIDFGTTNSCIAFSDDAKPFVLGGDQKLLPSVLSFDEGKWQVGKARGISIASIKRILGKSYDQIMASDAIDPKLKEIISHKDGTLKIKVDGKYFEPIYLASLIFSELKKIAERHLKQEIKKAVVSVPAYFDDRQKSAIKQAANMVGLDVIRLIQEPTAAGFAYGIQYKDTKGQYLVYDLGGGTFDVSLLNIQGKVIQVIAVSGDDMLGGDDIDHAVGKHLDISLKTAKKLKELVSPSKDATVDKTKLTWEEYEKIAAPIIEKTIKLTSSVVGLSNNLRGIILVGGSSKSPLIKKMLSKFEVEILEGIDPDRAVALGAALQAENLSRAKSHILIDVLPLSLGIEVMGGLNDKVIMKNTPIPTCVKRNFTTYADNQYAIKFRIIQGEREFAKDCREVGFFELSGLSPMPAGLPKVEVNFMIDADGLLYINASESISGVNKELVVEMQNLNQDVTDILQESFEKAEEDLNARILKEQILKAEDLISKVHKILHKLSKDHDLGTFIQRLQDAIESEDTKRIKEAYETLEAKFTPICLDHFNNQISKLLQNTKISKFD